ncbi:MAG: M3 family metallopeptidase [Elusimicrobiota bacterium]|jgi:thimet oligopeptidase
MNSFLRLLISILLLCPSAAWSQAIAAAVPGNMASSPITAAALVNPAISIPQTSREMAQTYKAAEAEYKAALDAIVAIPAQERTFSNTVAAIDHAGDRFKDAAIPLEFFSQVSPEARIRRMSEAITRRADRFGIKTDAREDIYHAYKEYAAKGETLTGEDKKRLETILRDYKRDGMELPLEERANLDKIRTRMSELSQAFEKNISDYDDGLDLTLEELAGMPESYIQGLPRTQDGKYHVGLDYPSYFPFMDRAQNPSLRKQLEQKYADRAAEKNVPILEEALTLRQKLANMLGYPTIAHYNLEDRIAKTPENALSFLNRLKEMLKGPAAADDAAMLEMKKKEDPSAAALETWDRRYYAEKLQAERYGFDEEEVRQYFPVDRVVNGTLDFYQELLGITLREVQAKTWHEDVKLFEVLDSKTNERLSYIFLDLHPRKNKYGHAAAFDIVKARELPDGSYRIPVSAMVANFSKPTPGKPALLTHDEVETFYHEFGHLLHMSLTRARYSAHSGANTAWDFVEAPSQMMENFVWRSEVLEKISGHYLDPSKKLPPELLKKMLAARNFNSGSLTLRQVALASLDMAYHTLPAPVDTTAIIEKIGREIFQLAQLGTHYQASFGHLMNGYDAGYYGYLWSKVYAQDIFSRFEKDGVLNPVVGQDYRRTILARGSSMPEGESLKEFLGREPNEDAFLKSLGLEPQSIATDQSRHPGESRDPGSALAQEHVLLPDFETAARDMEKIYASAEARLVKALDDVAAQKPGPKGFERTAAAMEEAYAAFNEAVYPSLFLAQVSADASVREHAQDLEKKVNDLLVNMRSREDVYRAVKACALEEKLEGEDLRLRESILAEFKRSGMDIAPEKKSRFNELKKRIASLEMDFETNIQEDQSFVALRPEELGGLPADFLAGIAPSADGSFQVPLDYPHYTALMENAKSPVVRAKMEALFNNKSIKNLPLLKEVLSLRTELAGLIGFASYADYAFSFNRIAKSPAQANSFLERLRSMLAAPASAELKELLELKRQEEPGAERIENRDLTGLIGQQLGYYPKRYRQEKFSVDMNATREYFPTERVVRETLAVFQDLFGLEFKEVSPKDSAAQRWHPEIQLYEIHDKKSGELLAHIYFDLYPREGKYNHAMAQDILPGRRLADGSYRKPVAAMVDNFSRASAQTPALMDMEEVLTFLHELGHLLHMTLTQAKYWRFAGANTAMDFVETPSQMMENFGLKSEVLERISGHWKDPSQKLPKELLKQVVDSTRALSALGTLRVVALAAFDLALNTLEPVSPASLLHRIFLKFGYLTPTPGTHFEARFGHLMNGEYAAGYYSYPWAQIFAHDVFSRFKKEGVLNPAVGADYRRSILERGSSRPEEDSLKEFLGREPNEEAFLNSLGIAPQEGTKTAPAQNAPIERPNKSLADFKNELLERNGILSALDAANTRGAVESGVDLSDWEPQDLNAPLSSSKIDPYLKEQLAAMGPEETIAVIIGVNMPEMARGKMTQEKYLQKLRQAYKKASKPIRDYLKAAGISMNELENLGMIAATIDKEQAQDLAALHSVAYMQADSQNSAF